MGSEIRPLHVFFFPFLAHGHITPMLDIAKLFASKGVKATIITTPLNVPLISKSLAKPKTPIHIQIQTISFPCAEAGLPEGCENAASIPSPDLTLNFFKATTLLQEPLEQVLQQSHPDYIVADAFFPWATHSASKFGIPTFVFPGIGFFALCATECMRLYHPFQDASTDSKPFVIPNLPGEITLTRMQVPDYLKNNEDSFLSRLLIASKEVEVKSYGVIVNSFYELEKDYADHYRNVLGRKTWHIGPVSIWNINAEEKVNRGEEAAMDKHECLKWLDTKKPNSLTYVCFGTVTFFPESQLREIAMGLEASGQEFIWVFRRSKKDEEEDKKEWLPEGFEKRMEGKGLIVRDWAPQVLILEHQAIGAFVTHCGWNSTLESVSAGVPMVTWPMFAEQFYNEKLISEILRVGVGVGVKKWSLLGSSVEWRAIEKAVRRIMEGEEAEEMRNRAKELGRSARKAVEKGGSSYSDLNALIDELTID